VFGTAPVPTAPVAEEDSELLYGQTGMFSYLRVLRKRWMNDPFGHQVV
jgi:hypothetical protein